MNVKEFFDKNVQSNSMSKFDIGIPSPILIMLGRDNKSRPVFSLSQIYEKNAFKSSKAIEVSVKNLNEMGFRYDFKLTENQYMDIFCKVVEDLLVSASGEHDISKYTKRLIDRYKSWLNFWKNGSSSLSMAERQGLFGELYYINSQLNAGADPDRLMLSWRGPERADQDFIEKGFWAEIKTVESSKDSVIISSIQQLNNPAETQDEFTPEVDGRLVVIKVNNMPAVQNPVSLYQLVHTIKNTIKDYPVALDVFYRGLELYGLPLEEEEKNNFTAEITSYKQYQANSASFPKFKAKDINPAVTAMTYSLSLAGIEAWRIEND